MYVQIYLLLVASGFPSNFVSWDCCAYDEYALNAIHVGFPWNKMTHLLQGVAFISTLDTQSHP
jgi:hypothetical protein